MRRFTLFVVIVVSSLLMLVLGQVLPWASALFILLFILFAYMAMLNILLLIEDVRQKGKRQPNWNCEEHGYPHISIVVPAHNEAPVLKSMVKQLFDLTYPAYDVLIMDDRSEDNSAAVLAELATEYADKYADKSFRYVSRDPSATPGKSAVLNDAFAITQGQLIAVFDADARMAPDFFEGLIPVLMSEASVGGVQARKVIGNTDQGFLPQCQYYEYLLDSLIQFGRDHISGGVEFRGNGQVLKRAAVEAVGGWNENSITDDLDLSTRFHMDGWDIRFVPTTTVTEEGIVKPIPLLRQRRRWTEGALVRYLDYGPKILTADRIEFRVKMDAIAYIIEFLYPMWVVMDHVYTLVMLAWGSPTSFHTVSTFLVVPLLGFFFFSLFVMALLRFEPTMPKWRIPYRAAYSAVYMSLTWVPMSIWVMGKLLLRRTQTFEWGKTEHYGLAS